MPTTRTGCWSPPNPRKDRAPRMDGPAFPIPIAGLPGWSEAEAEALLAGLARHLDPGVLTRPAQAAWLGALAPALARRGRSARRTVDEAFLAWRLPEHGFLTAYYEPVVVASRRRAGPFQTPLHRRPPDLIRVPARPDLPGDGTWARRRRTRSGTARRARGRAGGAQRCPRRRRFR